MKIRVGFGFDVHRLVTDRELWLGGVRLEHEKGLLGHSDTTLQKYNGENIRKVDGLRFALPFLRFAFLLKISPDVHFLPCFLVKPNSFRKFAG